MSISLVTMPAEPQYVPFRGGPLQGRALAVSDGSKVPEWVFVNLKITADLKNQAPLLTTVEERYWLWTDEPQPYYKWEVRSTQ